jgi:hypothetical protein
MPELISHPGSCHCGAVHVAFRTDRPLTDLALRRCGCSFCRRHGARTVADPGGELVIRAAEGALNRYRFGLRTADFLVCANCGVCIAALIGHAGRAYATLNANVLEARDSLDPAPPLVDYEGESAEGRIARRVAKWTPARVETARMTRNDG